MPRVRELRYTGSPSPIYLWQFFNCSFIKLENKANRKYDSAYVAGPLLTSPNSQEKEML